MAEVVGSLIGSDAHVWWSFGTLPTWSPQQDRALENRGFLDDGDGGDTIRADSVWPVGTYIISDISIATDNDYEVTLTLAEITDS